MSDAQIILIRDFLSGDLPAATRAPYRLSRERAEVALAWKPDNPWAAILDDETQFRFKRNPMATALADRDQLQRCGLPPFSDLEEFGYPSLFHRFEAAKGAGSKAKTCWDLCAKWIADNIVHDPSSHNVVIMRERAWSLLFGIRYGFAHEVKTLARVRLPSPWSPQEYVLAELIG